MKNPLTLIAAVIGAILLPVGSLWAHDEKSGEASFMHFLRDNGLYLQIGGGVVLVVAVAVFILMRRAKKRANPTSQPPTSGEAPTGS